MYRSLKQDCKPAIKFSLSEDGQHLVVSGLNEEHNHNITTVSFCSSVKLRSDCNVFIKAIYQHLPRQRKLNAEDISKAEVFTKMKVNKKLLQQHLSKCTGKIITLKDLSNIQTGLNKSDDNSLENVISTLQRIEGDLLEKVLKFL